MSFPLYDIFTRQASSIEDLTPEQKRKLIADIKLLNQDGLDNLYLIIRYAARVSNDEKVYDAKYNRKGVVFNLDLMSGILQKTIWCFVQRHIETSQEQAPGVEIVFE